MDAHAALAELTDISPQIRHVVVVAADGAVVGSNLDAEPADQLARQGRELAAEADAVHGSDVVQLEAATGAGSVFVVRDRGRTIVATTRPEPTVGLVFYDLKTALRSIDGAEEGDGDGEA